MTICCGYAVDNCHGIGWQRGSHLQAHVLLFIRVSTEDYATASFTHVGRWLSGSNDLWGD